MPRRRLCLNTGLVVALLLLLWPGRMAGAASTVSDPMAIQNGERTVTLSFELDMTHIDGVVIERRDPDGSTHQQQLEWGPDTVATQIDPDAWRIEWTDSPASAEMHNLETGQPYRYRVRGWWLSTTGVVYDNWSGEVSVNVMIFGTVLPVAGPPAAPTNLTAVAGPGLSVRLNWQDNATDEIHFAVSRRTSITQYVEIGTSPMDWTQYTDDMVLPGTTYFYRVSAFNINGYSPPVEVSYTVPGNSGGGTSGSTSLSGASSWAVPELQQAITYGLTTNRVLNDFQKPITREEFCELAVKLYEALSGTPAVPVSPNPFSDTANPDILKAFGLGITNGVAPDRFAPGNPITRQEIAVMIVRAVQAAVPGLSIAVTGVPQFADGELIAPWAIDQIRWCYHFDIMKGVGNNRIDPLGNTTREQAVVLVKRTYEKK